MTRFCLRALAVLLLAACTQTDDTVRVRFVPVVSGAELAKACPSLIGESTGCTVHEKDGSVTIYGVPPKNVEDERAMVPIGHEFYCHAWLNQPHTKRDPSMDCLGPRT